jgi:hypothetical protein
MELKIGLKFKKYYNDNNINNIDYCEVRGIVDNYIIVLWCEKKKNKLSSKKSFYKTIDITDFEYNKDKHIYQPI